jgi:MULE transposase domain/Ulp1 protease family, C-terminal catalytic domain
MEFIRQSNELVATPVLAKENAKKVTKIRASLKAYSYATLNAASKLVAPIVYGSHFFVLVIECSGITRGFYKSVQCYDSLDRKKTRRHGGRPEVNDFLEDYHRFLVDYVIRGNSERFSLRFPSSAPKNIDFCACPKQRNGIDCGLFAVAVVLHLIDGIQLTVDTFNQEIITALRNNLTSHFANVKSFRTYTLPSGIVRGVFGALPATNDREPHSSDPDIEDSVLDHDEVQVVKVVETKADTLAAYRARYKANDDASTDSNEDRKIPAAVIVKSKKTTSAAIASRTRSAAAAKNIIDVSSTDSNEDRKMPAAVIVKSQKTAAAADDSSTDSEKTMDDAVATFIARRLARRHAAQNVPVTVDSKKTTQPPNEVLASSTIGTPVKVAESASSSLFNTIVQMLTPASLKKSSAKTEVSEEQTIVKVNKTEVSEEQTIVKVKAIPKENESESGRMQVDTVFRALLKDLKVDSFATLQDVEPLINDYERETGNHLVVRRSNRQTFRVYRCAEHPDCPFKVHVGRRRHDGRYCVKATVYKHSMGRRPARAGGGRKWKERRATMMNELVVEAMKTKEGSPTSADIVKTAALLKGEVVPYDAAYRILTQQSQLCKKQATKGYELIIPYLKNLSKTNPDSVVGYECDRNDSLYQLYIIPGFMNRVLKHVRPVISLDAAHMKLGGSGTLFIASTLSAANEVYPIGFLLSAGNEDNKTWTTFLLKLREACPIIIKQGDDSSFPFCFVSDRDKGLKQALKTVFPDNVDLLCVKHIEANVRQRFGAECASYVFPIARTFSTRQQQFFMDKVHKIKTGAASYLENIDGLWKNTSWLEENPRLPPRYGILTSNTSECVNSMFLEARSLPWLDATEKIIDIMTSKISTNRRKYLTKAPQGIVARVAQEMKTEWDSAASLEVYQLEADKDQYKVVGWSSGESGDQRKTSHLITPQTFWCTCGLCQDLCYPCRHYMAIFRKVKEYTYAQVIESVNIANFYKYTSLQNLYHPNIIPVIIDTIKYDGKTKPPIRGKRAAGRPKVKRYRRRSELLDASESKIKCSLCGARGHNRRTCSAPKTRTLENLSL